MAELYEIWQRAEASRRLDVLSGFIAMCVAGDDDARRRLAQLVAGADTALSASPPDLVVASEYLDELVWWADTDWTEHPYRPVEARPDEADRQTRDYAKDLRHAALPVCVRDEMGRIELSLEVRFPALCRQPGLDCRVRQDIFYVAGRAAMTLDLGHLEAAEREIRRMEQVGSVEPQESRCS
ncbi:hypothetical protein [Streptomyces brasiliensis]|uniref:Uncharacterized protein n=1 Tax=Streptomyces brasiliensis TaxID=1954 RepID=A0A917L808_9ACTN|nr:hypothetical protein [Streptomyces brasiliensis]GGJ48693.1 hypothetical protein GCM10010121_069820 [Streptomyces brasiliensis]